MGAPSPSIASDRPTIGITSNFMHADPTRPVFKGMTLQYLEQRMAMSIYRAGAIPLGLPDLGDAEGAEAVLSRVDGVVFAGGADCSPRSYGEKPLRREWEGDEVRDAYELRVVESARARGLPLLGICRGIQLLNVALGGRLYQDIEHQRKGALVHRDWRRYDALGHPIAIDPDSWISRVLDGATEVEVNSIHHQGIRELAPSLRPTAWAPDGVIEAVELTGLGRGGPTGEWIAAVQWHPEWLEDAGDGGDVRTASNGRASGHAIFAAFVERCRERLRALASG